MEQCEVDNKSVTEGVVKAAVDKACEAIEARRRMLEEPSSTLSRMQAHLQRLNRNKVVNPDGGSYSGFLKRAGGGPAGFVKRLGRHFVSWYLDPAFRKQTDVNKVLAVMCNELSGQIAVLEESNARLRAQNERLSRELAEYQVEMSRRIDKIEEAVAGGKSAQ